MEEQPSSHRLAQSMGVSAQNMQVMKASFFHEEEVPQHPGIVLDYMGSDKTKTTPGLWLPYLQPI